jgi:hypothetical protein
MSDDIADSLLPALRDDSVWKAQGIADELGIPLTKAQYLIRIGALTVGHLGPKLIFTTRRQLRRDISARIQDQAKAGVPQGHPASLSLQPPRRQTRSTTESMRRAQKVT